MSIADRMLLTSSLVAACLLMTGCSDDSASIDWSVARKHSQLVMDSLHTATAERFFDTAYFPVEKTREILSTMNSNCDPASRRGGYVTSEDGALTASPGTMDFIYDYEYTCASARFRLKYIPTSTGEFKLVSFDITDRRRNTSQTSPRLLRPIPEFATDRGLWTVDACAAAAEDCAPKESALWQAYAVVSDFAAGIRFATFTAFG